MAVQDFVHEGSVAERTKAGVRESRPVLVSTQANTQDPQVAYSRRGGDGKGPRGRYFEKPPIDLEGMAHERATRPMVGALVNGRAKA